ncbi:ATP-binding cassette sub-family C member 4-like isoform X2 [Ostrea edulis]|uniref:ATP-binding cassette sub-family C member 4-like isoform X2 n=1 Tax=Ostrea edulis TaxID=37623 RepID=UPI0024AE9263|nr:ATP-binding cassette sub-family C member 4-like isoform X2 [Ostrea edulis]
MTKQGGPDTPKNSRLQGPCPFGKTNWLSRFTFWWMFPLFRFGFRHPLTQDHLYDVLPEDESELLGDRMERAWDAYSRRCRERKKKPSLYWAVIAEFKWEWGINGIFLVISEGIRILQPYLTGQIVSYFQPGSSLSSTEVYIYATVMGVSTMIQLLVNPKYFFTSHHIALKMKVAVASLIYRKILKMSSWSKHATTSGKIINHLSTDLEKFTYTIESFHFCWLGPLEICGILYLLYRQIGYLSLLTLAVIGVLLPLQVALGWIYGKLRMKIGAAGDQRIHLMNQIIAGMRVIKMYCWEKPFSQIIFKLRRSEMSQVWKAYITKALNIAVFQSAATIISISLFGLAWYMEIPLSARKIYSTLGWILCLRLTIFLYMMYLVEDNKQLSSSLKRIQSFLAVEDMKVFSVFAEMSESMEEDGVSIRIQDMTASWNSPGDRDHDSVTDKLVDNELTPSFALKNINLDVKQGELLAVVGSVGSGKSSLLMCLLKELPPAMGKLHVNGIMGYASQIPWVVSGTLQDNITFGDDVKEERYSKVLQACALYKDLDQMRLGDQTLVGERGLLLSGGQKSRLTLARTIYREADVYLLDDPLGAVDTDVGSHLFQKCICEFLRGKTRILVTHQLQYLRSADRIVILNEGRVVSVGTYDELVRQGTEFSLILSDHDKDMEEPEEEQDKKVKSKVEKNTKENTEDEFSKYGNVGWKVYKDYFLAGHPWLYLPIITLLTLVSYASYGYGDWHLARWVESTELLNLQTQNGSLSQNLNPVFNVPNQTLLQNLSHITSPNQNFTYSISLPNQTTPYLNDSSDVSVTPQQVDMLMKTYLVAITMFITGISLFGLAYFRMSVSISKQLHNTMFKIVLGAKTYFFDSNPVAQSPVFSHVSDTLVGLQSIRALGMNQKFLLDFNRFQNKHTIASFVFLASYRWFSLRSLFFLDVYFILVVFLSLALRDYIGLSGGLFGMAINYLLSMADPFEYLMRVSTTLNTQMTSVERIMSYTKVEQEAPKVSGTPPAPSWPLHGEIRLVNVGLQYSSNTDQVLHDISCHIHSQEKIGIVGRTGAGKSSLLAALLRLAEPTGEIQIDGINVMKIGLHELRNKISVIPQDPILFSGTLRKNLDPFEEYLDDQLWDSLEQVQLKIKVQSESEGLYMEMSEGGQNLSVGQRQLVCLARAILRQNKILILDEATANVDHNTDTLIQETIRSRFHNCTVLTVAHRIHTIMDSDRVMVLDQGNLVEFNTPFKLLQNENGFFKNLVQQTGKAQAKHLLALAEKHHKEQS